MPTPDGFGVVAAFDDERRARRAVRDLHGRGLPGSHVRIVRPDQDRDRARVGELRAEMQQEVVEGVAGPAIGFFTPDQAKGALSGAIAGGVLGLAAGCAVGWFWALGAGSSIPTIGRVAIAAASFMVGGGTIGFIAGGALKPRLSGMARPGRMLDERTMAGQGTTLVSVEAASESQAAVAHDVLAASGALRVDHVDRAGEPLAPQAEHPRPADPPGYWRNGGRGKG